MYLPYSRTYVATIIQTTVCTNDYPYSDGFSSCTFLYEWLFISFRMGFHHAHFCTNDYPFLLNGFSSMHISVRMTNNSFWMGFRHAHFCTNDYHFFLNRFSSCTFLYEWLPFYLRLAYIKPNFLTTLTKIFQESPFRETCSWRSSKNFSNNSCEKCEKAITIIFNLSTTLPCCACKFLYIISITIFNFSSTLPCCTC